MICKCFHLLGWIYTLICSSDILASSSSLWNLQCRNGAVSAKKRNGKSIKGNLQQYRNAPIHHRHLVASAFASSRKFFSHLETILIELISLKVHMCKSYVKPWNTVLTDTNSNPPLCWLDIRMQQGFTNIKLFLAIFRIDSKVNFLALFRIYLQLSAGGRQPANTEDGCTDFAPGSPSFWYWCPHTFFFTKIHFSPTYFLVGFFFSVVCLTYFWPLASSLPHFDTVTYFPILGPTIFLLGQFFS